MIVFARPIKFVLLFTFENVLAVGRLDSIQCTFQLLFCISGSTAFFLRPAQQLRMMFDTTRVFTTTIYIGYVVIVLICVLWVSHTPLIIHSYFFNMLIILESLIFLLILAT
ncbi:hypothetical protein AHAS_Ahas15G0104300 [Arachis hypogaea]